MNVRKRQALFALDSSHGVVCQAGAMQWIAGKVEAGTNVNSVGNFAKKLLGASATGESVVKPLYTGEGLVVLESRYPREELVEVVLEDDELKVDGNFAVCWSASLSFTVERSAKNLIGSAASGEGLVNVYRGTGRVLMAPL